MNRCGGASPWHTADRDRRRVRQSAPRHLRPRTAVTLRRRLAVVTHDELWRQFDRRLTRCEIVDRTTHDTDEAWWAACRTIDRARCSRRHSRRWPFGRERVYRPRRRFARWRFGRSRGRSLPDATRLRRRDAGVAAGYALHAAALRLGKRRYERTGEQRCRGNWNAHEASEQV